MSTSETYRTSCGRGRSSYDPTWSPSKPWSVVLDGTVLYYGPTRAWCADRLARLIESGRRG